MRRLRRRTGPRQSGLLLPHWSNTHGERYIAKDAALACMNTTRLPRIGIDELWERYTHHQFALSPRGHGLDSHRTWELLFFGAIPIVKTSRLDAMYRGLPVVIVTSWQDVCTEGFLGRAWGQVKPHYPAPDEVFTLRHWIA